MCQHWLGPSLSCASATRNFSQPTWRSSRQSGPNCEALMPAKNRETLYIICIYTYIYILESHKWRPYKKCMSSENSQEKRNLALEWESSTWNYDLSDLKVHIHHALPCSCCLFASSFHLYFGFSFCGLKMSTSPQTSKSASAWATSKKRWPQKGGLRIWRCSDLYNMFHF